jgi:ectoine hydroxylase-related dioxygenase (phytanoyl-CoA dioxygenase family)
MVVFHAKISVLAVQEWHADGPHMGPCAGPDGTGESQPYGACVFLPLHDLKACPEMGCTQFWPGTHKYSHLLGFGPAASEMHLALDALASPSEAVIYDYRTLHRGLANDSNQQREVLQLVYHVTSYSEGRNYRGPSLCENSCM